MHRNCRGAMSPNCMAFLPLLVQAASRFKLMMVACRHLYARWFWERAIFRHRLWRFSRLMRPLSTLLRKALRLKKSNSSMCTVSLGDCALRISKSRRMMLRASRIPKLLAFTTPKSLAGWPSRTLSSTRSWSPFEQDSVPQDAL